MPMIFEFAKSLFDKSKLLPIELSAFFVDSLDYEFPKKHIN